MTECTNENIHLFIKYMRGELHRKEERQVDSHVQSCQDCYFNFAYVEEIFRNRQKLSIDEKTLLFKYISDPIWQHEQNKLKQQIKQEILTELKLLNNIAISAGVSKNDTASPTSKSDRVNNSEINNSNSNTRKESNESNDTNASLIRQNSQLAHRGYSIFFAVAFTIIFLSLSTSIYLIVKNQNLSLFTSSTISSSRVSSSPITTSSIAIADNTSNINYTRNTFVDNNLYQQLDSAIDRYLESKGSYHLKQAQDIANDIERKYGDKYGVDLVSYYQAVPDSIKQKLLPCRKTLTQLTNQPIGERYQQRLEETEKIAQQFISFGNLIEAYKTKALVAKLKVKLLKYDQAEIITSDGLHFAQQNNYIILRAYFLLWQAKRLVEVSEFSLAEDIFKETIDLGKLLEIDELLVSPSMTLAATYLKNNDNAQALEIAQNILANCKNCNIEHTISLLQIAGVAAFNSKFSELSRAYLDKAIQLSKGYNSYSLAMSYTFLAVTLTDSKEFDKAEEFYSKAITVANSIKEQTAKLEVTSIILGYQAKAKLINRDLEKAAKLYQETLVIINDLHLNNSLEISQLQEGLAMALKESGKEIEARKHFAIAKNYQQIANESKQNANCLLSFIPNNCTSSKY